jgi:hypothetical protein
VEKTLFLNGLADGVNFLEKKNVTENKRSITSAREAVKSVPN